MFLRRSLKFLHTPGAIGLSGGLAACMIVLAAAPDIGSLEAYAALRESPALVANRLLVPSMMVVLVSGLLAMAAHYPIVNAPWVWIKALSGILIFEATLASIDGPAQRAAAYSARALDGELLLAELRELVGDEWGAWWMLLALSLANVALAVWRPRFRRCLPPP